MVAFESRLKLNRLRLKSNRLRLQSVLRSSVMRLCPSATVHTCIILCVQAAVLSQVCYGTSKNPKGFCKVHNHAYIHVHLSKVSVPSQVYYGTSKNPMGFCKVQTHTSMYMCPRCPSHPKCTMVPQRIPWDSVRYRHIHPCTCVQGVRPIPSVLWYLKESHGIL